MILFTYQKTKYGSGDEKTVIKIPILTLFLGMFVLGIIVGLTLL